MPAQNSLQRGKGWLLEQLDWTSEKWPFGLLVPSLFMTQEAEVPPGWGVQFHRARQITLCSHFPSPSVLSHGEQRTG